MCPKRARKERSRMRVHRTGGSCLRASQARRTRGAAHGEWVRRVDAWDAEAVRAIGREASRPPRTVLVVVARELGAAVSCGGRQAGGAALSAVGRAASRRMGC